MREEISTGVNIHLEIVSRQKIWHKTSKKLRETFIDYSPVLLVHA